MSDIHDKHPNEELLQAFLDGDVPKRERRRIEEHVESCARCSDELAHWRGLFEGLDALPMHRPSADFEARVMAGVQVPDEMPWAARVKARLASLAPQARPTHLPTDLLQELAEGTLTARRAARAEAHLETCTSCAAELRSWASVMDGLSALERFEPTEGFADRVMVGFEAATASKTEVVSGPAASPRWTRMVAATMRFVPRTRRAWAAISGAAVTPAVTFGLVLWAVFSHPTLTPQALASFAFWQLSDLAVAAWTGLVSGGLEAAQMTGLDGLLSDMAGAPALTAAVFLSYAVAFIAAVRILYKNLMGGRAPRHRYVSASAS